MAPPPSHAVSPLVCLIIRVITFVCLLISLILLTTARQDLDEGTVKFDDFKAFKYLCAATVIGLAYSLLQIAFTICLVSTGNRFGGEVTVYVDFYGDKVVSFILATGAAASFGMTQDLSSLLDAIGVGITHFINTTNAAASLCLLGSVFTVVSSVFSSFALPKRASIQCAT